MAVPDIKMTNDVNLHAMWKPSRYSSLANEETSIELTSATPSAAPICRAVLFNAEPIANFVCGRKAVAELEIVEIHSPTPIPV